jgi:hypothetical protein
MCSAPFRSRAGRSAMPAAMLAAALVAAGCTAALGPGYTVERQHLEVAFVAAPQPHVSVRATWRVKNTGNRALSAVELRVPDAKSNGLGKLRLESAGSDVPPVPSKIGDTVSLAFPAPLAVNAKQEIAVSYELDGVPRDGAGVVVQESGFVLPPGDWAPSLLPPEGSFARVGEPPEKWDMTVRIPAGFRVHASGRERGQKREAGAVVLRWEQQREGLPPFVAAGAYQEESIAAAGVQVIFWTRQPMPPGPAQRAAEAEARTAEFFETEFGPREEGTKTVRIIECPAAQPCPPVPGAALPGAKLYTPETWTSGVWMVDRELARTWLDFRVHPDWATEPYPMGALADYSADLAAIGREGAGARGHVVNEILVQLEGLEKSEPARAIAGARLSDPVSVRRYAEWKSELFFLALGDAVGDERVDAAIRHLLRTYAGGKWRAADLRSALELESGRDLGGLFRAWLTETAIPKDFRDLYESGKNLRRPSLK